MRSLWAWRLQSLIVILLVVFALAACGKSSSTDDAGAPPAQLAAGTTDAAKNPSNAVMTLEPASGYGGLYVQVNGTKWPQNMMVLVTIEDAQGRSDTLAAIDTDPTGNLTTGFLFPIDQRWLASKSLAVVATTADGQIETKATFTLVPPGTEVAASPDVSASSPANSPLKTVGASDKASSAVTGTVTGTLAGVNEEFANTVVLPLIASTGAVEGGAASGKSKNRNNKAKSQDSAITQVDVDIKPEGSNSIDCGRGDRWISVAIYSSNGFDATSVDPNSVTISDGSSDLGYGGEGTTTFVAYRADSLKRPAANSSAAYVWRWHLDDVDGDGSTDMVLEYRIDYLKLSCNSAVLEVSGRTSDGRNFTGSNQAEKLVVKKS